MGIPLKRCSDEALRLPLYEDTPFPPQEQYKWIQDFFHAQYDLMHGQCLKLMELIAIGLGMDRNFFRPWFADDSLSTFRAIHGMPRSANIVDSSKLDPLNVTLTCSEHRDAGFVTILSTLGYPGLQINMGGEWKSVKPVHN